MRLPCEVIRIPGTLAILVTSGSHGMIAFIVVPAFRDRGRRASITIQYKAWYKAGVNVQSGIMADGTIIIVAPSITRLKLL